ncbi:MAG TPA: hypothetical protein ENO00_11385 [Deltaproteobacteria bacterium]|nr:hypothetical protein [Deltaproteobacteria bacterium]
MNNHMENHESIVSGLIDGSVAIDSLEELRKLLNAVPHNPTAVRVIGDSFVKQGAFEEAVGAYQTAVSLYIETGRILPAIASKVLKWNLIRSAERECREIYSALRDIEAGRNPVHDYLARMAYPELMAVMGEMELVTFPPGTLIREMGVEENDLNLIVSGVLSEKRDISKNGDVDNTESVTENPVESGFFGDIYPFDEVRLSRSRIEAVSHVEVLTAQRSDLIRISRKHAAVEFLTMELCSVRSGTRGKKSLQITRATKRYQLQTKVTLKIFPENAGDSHLVINGFTEDVSQGGTCIRLGEAYWAGSSNLVGKTVKLLINIPKLSTGIDVLGNIVWRREVEQPDRKTILIGIQFRELSRETFDFLKKHCYVGDGEQDMIYSLWESYVKK